jgi:hypothetical protein
LASVLTNVTRGLWAISLLFVSTSLAAAPSDAYTSAQRKLDAIEGEQLPPGAHVILTYPELEAWAAKDVPAGVRNPRLRAPARNLATGSALIDFGKLERSAGRQPGWLMSKLLDGERPVTVTVRLHSAAGLATVDIQRVEISGLVIDGRTLDFLIRNFLIPMYPSAIVGRPFELGRRIDRIDVAPSGVTVGLK